MRTLTAATLVLLACLTSTQAEEIMFLCGPISGVLDISKYRTLSRDEWLAARILFFNAKDTPAEFPPGEEARILEQEDGTATVIFIEGDHACSAIKLLSDAVRMMAKIRAGKVTHLHSPGTQL